MEIYTMTYIDTNGERFIHVIESYIEGYKKESEDSICAYTDYLISTGQIKEENITWAI